MLTGIIPVTGAGGSDAPASPADTRLSDNAGSVNHEPNRHGAAGLTVHGHRVRSRPHGARPAPLGGSPAAHHPPIGTPPNQAPLRHAALGTVLR